MWYPGNVNSWCLGSRCDVARNEPSPLSRRSRFLDRSSTNRGTPRGACWRGPTTRSHGTHPRGQCRPPRASWSRANAWESLTHTCRPTCVGYAQPRDRRDRSASGSRDTAGQRVCCASAHWREATSLAPNWLIRGPVPPVGRRFLNGTAVSLNRARMFDSCRGHFLLAAANSAIMPALDPCARCHLIRASHVARRESPREPAAASGPVPPGRPRRSRQARQPSR